VRHRRKAGRPSEEASPKAARPSATDTTISRQNLPNLINKSATSTFTPTLSYSSLPRTHPITKPSKTIIDKLNILKSYLLLKTKIYNSQLKDILRYF
jgi:hypothetical protein